MTDYWFNAISTVRVGLLYKEENSLLVVGLRVAFSILIIKINFVTPKSKRPSVLPPALNKHGY